VLFSGFNYVEGIMSCFKKFKLTSLIATLGLFVIAGPTGAQTPYYAGKTITIVRGGGPGGSGEFQSRALMPYLKKYIPGNPTITMEFMDGASGRKGANYMYTAKPDGLKIGSAGAMIPGPVLGLSGSNYDIDKFIYIGSTETGNPYVFFTRKTAAFDSLDKVRNARGIRIGAHSVGHSVYVTARMFAYFLDFKEPKFVVGFNDPEMDVALNNGELDGRTSSNIDSVLKDLGAGVQFHATISNPKGRYDSRLPGLADIDTFAKNDKERNVVNLLRAFQVPRWPHHLSPGTPPELVKTLREAMARTFKDPGFQQDFKKLMGREPTPLTGEEVEKAIRDLPRDAEVIALYKKLAEAGPLPAR
jgi:tripartite-type tricarboxylate transporter receptor subunit TctC